MTTDRQRLGEFGERLVCKRSNCPRCKRPTTLRRLPTNFKCADIICDLMDLIYPGFVAATGYRSSSTAMITSTPGSCPPRA